MDISVIDNFLPEQEFAAIQELMLSDEFPWFYQNDVAYDVAGSTDFYFTHLFYDKSLPNSGLYSVLAPLIERIQAKAVVRAKGNLFPNLGREVINNMHIDYDYTHKGAVFGINTNNGYTLLEDGTKIESVANRILFFNPAKLHASAHCTDEKRRINVNINFF